MAAGSGERKSPVLSELERPLKDVQARERDQVAPLIKTARVKAELSRKRHERAMATAAKSESLEDEDNAIRSHEAWQKAEAAVPRMPTWIIGADGTPEAFVSALVEHTAVGITARAEAR